MGSLILANGLRTHRFEMLIAGKQLRRSLKQKFLVLLQSRTCQQSNYRLWTLCKGNFHFRLADDQPVLAEHRQSLDCFAACDHYRWHSEVLLQKPPQLWRVCESSNCFQMAPHKLCGVFCRHTTPLAKLLRVIAIPWDDKQQSVTKLPTKS